jgi:hypothetical protein
MTSSNNFGGINGLDGLTKPVRDGFLKGIRAGHEKVEMGADNALSGAIEAGVDLLAVKSQIAIPMVQWMDRYLPLIPQGTWKLYLRLAKPDNWAVIEAARKSGAKLSINAARKLITKTKPASGNKKLSETEGESSTKLANATAAELIAEIANRGGPNWLITTMPDDWRAQLLARLRGPVLRAEAAKFPDNTKMKKNILKLVHSADQPTTHH